ncbi:hypothetical protein [Azohydromonas australica]|uniref:hypothetical protein n=1 Tax=Azohydromonas australica TaxID=364039 RepID=UPI0012EB1FFF|nr:hypothetical protein [Azohydromonas australica]
MSLYSACSAPWRLIFETLHGLFLWMSFLVFEAAAGSDCLCQAFLMDVKSGQLPPQLLRGMVLKRRSAR